MGLVVTDQYQNSYSLSYSNSFFSPALVTHLHVSSLAGKCQEFPARWTTGSKFCWKNLSLPLALVEKDTQFNLVHLKNVHHKLIGNKSRWSLSLSLVTIWTCCIPLNAAAYKRYKSSLLNLFVYTEQMFSKLLIKLWARFQTRALWRIISSTFFFWLAKLRLSLIHIWRCRRAI